MRSAPAQILVISLLVLQGCASRTLIRSDPPGARVYVDGHLAGVTPYEHMDAKLAFTSTVIQLRKEGYEDFFATLRKDEELNTAACLFGPCCLVPYLWIFGYKSERLYVLEPEGLAEEEWPAEAPSDVPPGDEHLPQPWDPPL